MSQLDHLRYLHRWRLVENTLDLLWHLQFHNIGWTRRPSCQQEHGHRNEFRARVTLNHIHQKTLICRVYRGKMGSRGKMGNLRNSGNIYLWAGFCPIFISIVIQEVFQNWKLLSSLSCARFWMSNSRLSMVSILSEIWCLYVILAKQNNDWRYEHTTSFLCLFKASFTIIVQISSGWITDIWALRCILVRGKMGSMPPFSL